MIAILAKRNKAHETRPLAPPPSKEGFRPSEIVSGAVSAQELDDLLTNLVIVFEVFKRSQNLKAWLRFALQKLQIRREVREKNLGSWCILA